MDNSGLILETIYLLKHIKIYAYESFKRLILHNSFFQSDIKNALEKSYIAIKSMTFGVI